MIKTNVRIHKYIEHLASSDARIIKKAYKKGETLIEQGSLLNAVFLINYGVAKCFIVEENARTYVLDFISQGEIIGEAELLTEEQQYCTTVEAATILEAYVIPKEIFTELQQSDIKFNTLLLETLAARMLFTSKRASYQQIYPLTYSILKIIYEFNETREIITKNDLADYLGISLRSLNRAITQLVKEEIIAVNDEVFEVPNAQKLLTKIQSFY